MTRRSFLKHAGAGAATGGVILGAPAIVSAQQQVRWRMASSFPKSLDTLYGAADILTKRVAALTGGRFQVSLHAAGEIVPALQVLDAVQNGTIECGHTAMYYYFGKDPAWAFGTCVPFGLNQRQYNAWWYEAGGAKVFNEFANKVGVTAFVAGNTGTQMGGFFRKEIKTVADLKGLKFRIAGLAGAMLARLGTVPQQIAAGDIYSALEKGTIDAAEWVAPYDDEKLGLGKVAKFYYTPGFWEGGPALHALVNNKAWESLPVEFKAAFESATYEANMYMTARYDNQNPSALRRLLASGVQLRAFPKPVMDAAFKAAQEVYAELNDKNPEFKRLGESYFGFQREQLSWYGVAESRFDQFMQSTRA
ncbi:MAG TPA: TRAP transporter substrate-binding protein DctP [Burkholderiaceae bacterium]|nr:TRAP transporter substrate-binding protein DctP [Burkholderiaceae bacterium]